MKKVAPHRCVSTTYVWILPRAGVWVPIVSARLCGNYPLSATLQHEHGLCASCLPRSSLSTPHDTSPIDALRGAPGVWCQYSWLASSAPHSRPSTICYRSRSGLVASVRRTSMAVLVACEVRGEVRRAWVLRMTLIRATMVLSQGRAAPQREYVLRASCVPRRCRSTTYARSTTPPCQDGLRSKVYSTPPCQYCWLVSCAQHHDHSTLCCRSRSGLIESVRRTRMTVLLVREVRGGYAPPLGFADDLSLGLTSVAKKGCAAPLREYDLCLDLAPRRGLGANRVGKAVWQPPTISHTAA